MGYKIWDSKMTVFTIVFFKTQILVQTVSINIFNKYSNPKIDFGYKLTFSLTCDKN